MNPFIGDNTNRDVSDVVNYIRATEFALERLKTLPLCNRLIKKTHAVLLERVRGQEKIRTKPYILILPMAFGTYRCRP